MLRLTQAFSINNITLSRTYDWSRPVEECEELFDIEALRKARAEDDGYRISLEDFLKQNPQTASRGLILP